MTEYPRLSVHEDKKVDCLGSPVYHQQNDQEAKEEKEYDTVGLKYLKATLTMPNIP